MYKFLSTMNTKGEHCTCFVSLFIAFWFILFIFVILQTSIFTPSYGATTNVHITSKMTTQEVITQLLQKFKVSIIITIGNSIHNSLNILLSNFSNFAVLDSWFPTLILIDKFTGNLFSMQVENSPNEFALYCIHQSGGNVQLLIQFYVFTLNLIKNIFKKTIHKEQNSFKS